MMPKHGQIIVFRKAPPGSHVTEGQRYRVDRPGNCGAFRFVNVDRGSATFDRAWAVKLAVWVGG